MVDQVQNELTAPQDWYYKRKLKPNLMVTEKNKKICYPVENFHNPDWWDTWVKSNLKKKLRRFSKKIKQREL